MLPKLGVIIAVPVSGLKFIEHEKLKKIEMELPLPANWLRPMVKGRRLGKTLSRAWYVALEIRWPKRLCISYSVVL